MKFIQLNGKKALFRLFFNLFSYSIVALFFYGIIKRHNDPIDTTQIMLILVYGCGLFWFLFFFFTGWYAYRISRKLFTVIATLNIFDSNTYYAGYLRKNSRMSYTQECLYGEIDGYPVIVAFDLATDKGQTSKLNFYFITIKFKHTHKELLSISTNWLRGYEPISDVKKEVNSFIDSLKSKSIVMGNFEDVFADKYITPVESCN